MLCTAPFPTLAAAGTLCTRLQPTTNLLTRQAPSASIRTLRIQTPHPLSPIRKPIVRHVFSKTTIRSASTSIPTPSGTSNSATTPPTGSETLTWNRFLALRKTRRRISLASSLLCAAASAGLGFYVTTTRDLDTLGAQATGLDPLIMIPLITTAFVGAGWLIGPFFGNAVFGLLWRRWQGSMAQKEREFYARIKRYRVDPSSSSIQNPVPDYYGEKIGSVADYRRWLKDQRAFNLKRGQSAI